MKAIYLSASLLFFTVLATAQTNFLNRPVGPGLDKNFLIIQNKRPITSGLNVTEYGIIKLPHNSMPCFVPDVSLVAAMPTSKMVLPNQFIPNPFFNYTALPEATKENNISLPK